MFSLHTRKALLIALSHPLTINGRAGFGTTAPRRGEGVLERNGQGRGGWLLRKTLSPWLFPQVVVKGQRGGLLKATTSSSLDIGSKASPVG